MHLYSHNLKTLLIDDYCKVGNQYFYFDYHDGSYGYNTSSSRGADTFFPFNTAKYTCCVNCTGYNNYKVDFAGFAQDSSDYSNSILRIQQNAFTGTSSKYCNITLIKPCHVYGTDSPTYDTRYTIDADYNAGQVFNHSSRNLSGNYFMGYTMLLFVEL